jgi:hypothetical protein
LFKDAKKELERLEAALLEEEEEEEQWDEEDDLLDDDDDFGEEAPEVYRNFSNRYKAYNADRTDWDPEELGDELEKPRSSGIWGLCALALALIAGIFLALGWWYLKLNGGGL